MLNMSIPTLGRLKTHEIPHLHHNSRKFMPLNRHQLKIYAFSVKFNVCSKWVLLPWIKICRDFTPETQIFTQKNESWLRFYSEFLSKKLAAEGSALTCEKSVSISPKLCQSCSRWAGLSIEPPSSKLKTSKNTLSPLLNHNSSHNLLKLLW